MTLKGKKVLFFAGPLYEDLELWYPKIRLEPDRIYVQDGQIWSSAGISAGIDLALAMVAEDYGDEIARETARQLVLYHRRTGGQSRI